MAITGLTGLANGRQVVTVDHDPSAVATDAPIGSLISDASGGLWLKLDNGETTNVTLLGPKGVEEVTQDIDFAASASEDFTLTFSTALGLILRARVYIDADPGAAFSDVATISLYKKSTRLAEDLIARFNVLLVYTELSIATTGADADFTVDDNTDLNVDDIIAFNPGTPEFHAIKSLGAPNTTDDNIAAHAIDVGVVRVPILDWNTFDADGSNIVYGRMEFSGAVTVNTKLEVRAAVL